MPAPALVALTLAACTGAAPPAPSGGTPDPPPRTPVRFQRTMLTPPPGATVAAVDASGLELVLGGAGSRCGPTTARLEYVARDGAIPEPIRRATGHRCEDHVLIHHSEVKPAVLARLTCTARGEFEGAAPSVCEALMASLEHGSTEEAPPEATDWSVRPALDRDDRPEAVEYFRPGARVWFPAPRGGTLSLAPGLDAQVLVTDVHPSGDHTQLLAAVGGAPTSVVFEDSVQELAPAGPADGPDPVDLRVTMKEEPAPGEARAVCSIWRFEDGAYRPTGGACPAP